MYGNGAPYIILGAGLISILVLRVDSRRQMQAIAVYASHRVPLKTLIPRG